MARNPQPYKCSRDPLPLVAMGLALEVLFLLAVLGPFSLLDHGTRLVDLGFLTHYQPEAARLITAGLLALFLFYGFALTFAARSSLAIAILGTACYQ